MSFWSRGWLLEGKRGNVIRRMFLLSVHLVPGAKQGCSESSQVRIAGAEGGPLSVHGFKVMHVGILNADAILWLCSLNSGPWQDHTSMLADCMHFACCFDLPSTGAARRCCACSRPTASRRRTAAW